MIILLPPSESKQKALEGPIFDRSGLRLFQGRDPVVTQTRADLWRDYQDLLADSDAASRLLKLGRSASAELAFLRGEAAMVSVPAIRRYSGVLYKPLSAVSTDQLQVLAAAGHRVLVQSALFGLVDALDLIPYYRFSAGTRVGQSNTRARWQQAFRGSAGQFADHQLVDLRSNAYFDLAPNLSGSQTLRVGVIQAGSAGDRALNHFNKHSKGAFAASLISQLAAHRSGDIAARPELEDVVAEAAKNAKLGVEFDQDHIRLRVGAFIKD